MALPEGKSALETIFEDGEVVEDDVILMDDVEMLDAEVGEEDLDHHARPHERDTVDASITSREEFRQGLGVRDGGNGRRSFKKKKKKTKRRAPSDFRVTDINKFVIDTCRHLRERKSYLIWNAVGCLGVSAVSDLVKEVDAVQNCGGQKTVDGKRFRTGGGILWNILKSRDPKAYKEIMAKGREFEKQFKPVRVKDTREVKVENKSEEGEADVDSQQLENQSESKDQEVNDLQPQEEKDRKSSILSRIRQPVAYDDLFD